MKNSRKILLLIILLAAVLRLTNLGVGDLQNDEAKTALGVAFPHSLVLPTISFYSQKIFGVSETAVRFPFALLGIGGVLLWYFLGSEIKDKKLGLVFSLIAAVLPVSVILGRTAYLDVSLTFGWIGSILFFLRFERSRSAVDIFFLFLFLSLSVWFKIQAVYLFTVLGLVLICIKKKYFYRDERFWIMVLAVVVYASYLLGQPQQLYDVRHYLLDEVGANANAAGIFKDLLLAGGIWLAVAAAGMFKVVKDLKNKQNSLADKTIFLLAVLLTVIFLITPTRFYYLAMLEVPLVYFSGIWLYNRLRYFWLILAISSLCSLTIIWLSSSLSGDYFCNQKSKRCFWQINRVMVNNALPFDKTIFFDDDLGFDGKWYIERPSYKLDFLNEYLKGNQSAVAVIKKTGELPAVFSNWHVIVDTDRVLILSR